LDAALAAVFPPEMPDEESLVNPYEWPESPHEVRVRYNAIDAEGRFVQQTTIQALPENCSVSQLEQQICDLLTVSPRQPVELLHWGKVLDPSKTLKYYAIKPHSEIQVIIRPRLPNAALKNGEPLRRVRVSSSKLRMPIAVDGLTPETPVIEIKRYIQGLLCGKTTTYLAMNKSEADERTGTMTIEKGDQLTLLTIAPGGKKGLFRVRNVRTDEEGNALEAEMVPGELKLEPDTMHLFFDGQALVNDAPLSKYSLVHNERITLDFRYPWDDGTADAPKKDKGGGKKKK